MDNTHTTKLLATKTLIKVSFVANLQTAEVIQDPLLKVLIKT